MTKNKAKMGNSDDTKQGMELAMRLVAITYSVPLEELMAPTRRKANVAFARQLAMYLVHVGIGLNLTRVAKLFQRDRSTAAHACRLIEDLRDDEAFDDLVELLEKTLKVLYAQPGASRYPLKRKPSFGRNPNSSLRLH